MRRAVLTTTLLTIALVLAACGGAPTAEPTATPTTEATTAPNQTVEIPSQFGAIATTAAEAGDVVVQLPNPGLLVTVVPDAESEILSQPFDFNLITYQRYGGPDNVDIVIRLRPDGTLERNGETTTIDQAEVSRIRALFDRIGFFRLNGVFTGPDVTENTMYYSIGVDGPPGVLTIPAQDGMTPPELMELFDAMEQLGAVFDSTEEAP